MLDRPHPTRRTWWIALAALAALAPACQGPASQGERPAPSAARAGGRSLGDSLYPTLGNEGYDLLHVGLDLTLRPVDGHLDGIAELGLSTKRALTSLSLDLCGLSVSSVMRGEQALEFRQQDSKLELLLDQPVSAGTRLELRIAYAGFPVAISSPSVPIEPGVGWMRSGEEIYVLSQPNGAASVMPTNDHPLDKASYDVRLRVPRGWTAVSIGTLVSIEEDGELACFHFRSSAPCASCVFTFAVGHWQRLDQPSASVPLVYYFPAEATARQRELYGRSADILAYLEDRLGPYPFESCGALLSSLPMQAALETQTLPVYGAEVSEAVVIAHELAHQWLGNSVSLVRWRDIWLSEGLAEYMAWTWLESELGEDSFRQLLGQAYAYVHAQQLPPPGSPKVEQLFGAGVYTRGAWAAHALRQRIGERRFFELLARWVEKYRHANASLADFVALASEVAGEDVSDTLNAWLFAPSPPLDKNFAWALSSEPSPRSATGSQPSGD